MWDFNIIFCVHALWSLFHIPWDQTFVKYLAYDCRCIVAFTIRKNNCHEICSFNACKTFETNIVLRMTVAFQVLKQQIYICYECLL